MYSGAGAFVAGNDAGRAYVVFGRARISLASLTRKSLENQRSNTNSIVM